MILMKPSFSFALYGRLWLQRPVHQGRGRTLSTTTQAGSHYDTLQVRRDASSSDVKRKYYELSKLYHPDKNRNSKSAVAKFIAITDAYETLSSPMKRRNYDNALSNPIPASPSCKSGGPRTYSEAARRREDRIWEDIWRDINDDRKTKPEYEEKVEPIVLPRWAKFVLAVIFSWKGYILWNQKKRHERQREDFLRDNANEEVPVKDKIVSAMYKVSTSGFGPGKQQ